MKLSAETGALSRRFGDKETIRIFKDAGFDAFDYSMCCGIEAENILDSDNYMEYIKEIKDYADVLGIECNQAHAPFPSEDNGPMYNKIVRSIESAAYLGAKIIVIHPLKYGDDQYYQNKEDLFQKNIAFYNSLIPYAQKHQIKIAIENMYTYDQKRRAVTDSACSHSDEFNKYVDFFNNEYIVACLDLGHAVLVSDSPTNMLEKMGNRVQALHVHDVDYRIDNHTLPYLCNLNWDEICHILAQINYEGDFTYECGNFYSIYMEDDFIPVAAKFAEQVGRSLIRKIDRFKK